MLPTKFGVNWPLVQEKKQKIDFQDGGHGSHLEFLIVTILAIFVLQVTPSQLAQGCRRNRLLKHLMMPHNG